MTKIDYVEVNDCHGCCYLTTLKPHGRWFCWQTEREIPDPLDIPEWCPLPDKESEG